MSNHKRKPGAMAGALDVRLVTHIVDPCPRGRKGVCVGSGSQYLDEARAEAFFRLLAIGFDNSLSFWKANPPDPQRQPITHRLVAAYLFRTELQIQSMRGGAKTILEIGSKFPNLSSEWKELAIWISPLEPNFNEGKFTEENEGLMGDYLVAEMKLSYSQAKQLLGSLKKSRKGAPNKRIQTLKMIDARVAFGWSYSEIAVRMCDCGGSTHGEYCAERIRKRIKELEAVLTKFDIAVSQ